jgi:hypothetical protein
MPLFDDYPNLLKTILDGKAILFFGAGASRGARSKDTKKCPMGNDLADQLMNHFMNRPAEGWGLDRVVDFLERNLIDRAKINNRIFEIFDGFTPHEAYKQLFRFRWRALFTTNFDTLVRQAYDQTKVDITPKQQLLEIWKFPVAVDYGDHSKLYLFALHGSLIHHLDLSTPLVITKKDEIRTRENRMQMLNQLASMQGGGTVIYVGYSFQDEVFFELLNTLDSIHSLSHSFALMPQLKKTEINSLHQYKVEPLQVGFEKFMSELVKTAEQRRIVVEAPKHILQLGPDKKDAVCLTEEEYHDISSHFEILTEESLGRTGPEPVQFYRGFDNHWSFYERECDVIRSQTKGVLKGVLSYLERSGAPSPSGRANPVVLVSSTAGAGKSVMLRRVAYECYRRGYVVAWAVPEVIHTRGWDVQRLKNLSQRINGMKLLLIVDNCAGAYTDDGLSMYSLTADLLAELEAETIPAVILLSARSNEFCASQSEHLANWRVSSANGCSTKPLIQASQTIQFDDRLDDPEIMELVAKMRQHSAISADLSDEVYYARIRAGGKMLLMILYEVTDRGLRPFHDIVAEEFGNLMEPPLNVVPHEETALKYRVPDVIWDDLRKRLDSNCTKRSEEAAKANEEAIPPKKFNLTQRAFLFISALHQFGLRLPEQFLRRVLQVEWTEFMQKIVHEYALKVIVRDDTEDPPRYQTRHPFIAKTVFENLPTPDEKYEIMSEIVRGTEYNNYTERSLVYRLLDSEDLRLIFDAYKRCDLFVQALKQNSNDTFLLQHLGMLYMNDLHEFEQAKHFLEASRSLQPDNPAVLNSIAILAGKIGRNHLSRNEFPQADRQFLQAEQLFGQQRILNPSSEYTYHPHALMLYQQQMITPDLNKKIGLLAQALFKIAEGMTNVPSERDLRLLELEQEIFLHMEQNAIIDRLREMDSTRLASDVNATYILVHYDDHHDRGCDEILERLDRCLLERPHDRPLLRQKAMWLARLKPEAVTERIKLLTILFNMDPHDIWVTRELSYLAFLADEIDLHNKCRTALKDVRRHPDRSVPKMVVDPRTKTNRVYTGTVNDVDESGRYGWIVRHPYGDRIFFQPFKHIRLHLVPGARVSFSVGINFMGAVAHDITLA